MITRGLMGAALLMGLIAAAFYGLLGLVGRWIFHYPPGVIWAAMGLAFLGSAFLVLWNAAAHWNEVWD